MRRFPTNMTAAAPSVEWRFPNGDLYIGSVSGNVPHGSGKYLWKDGCTYEGEWCDGKASGKGKFSWPSGSTFEGEFKSGRMEGHGQFNGSDGDTYEGNWSANRKDGQGLKRYANGDFYYGFWKKNRKDGLGVYGTSNGTEYIGKFMNHVISGYGGVISADGLRYVGQWVNEVPKGLGTYTWGDGSVLKVCTLDPKIDLAAHYDGFVMDEDDGEYEIEEAVVKEICVEAWEEGTFNISTNGRFERNITRWEKGELLGRGSFGSVYKGISHDGFFFAVKEVSLLDQGSVGRESIVQLEQEIGLLSQFEHENIVQYYGTERDESKTYVFLELASKGSLLSLYRRNNLEDSQVSSYTRQILHGLKYLHDKCVVHRDIKCANILVDANGSVKIANFGLAEVTKLNDVKSCKGTPFWMAPEVVNQKNQGYGLPADIWSLGCTVLEMLTRLIPYSPLEWMQALFRIAKGEPPRVPDSLSNDARDFILQCLKVEPKDRPTAAQLLNHSFVRS